MMGSNRGIGLAMAILALCLAGPAGAVENLDSGKTGAQLYASDCVICHKNPGALAKAGGIFGLSSFLREHYTASSQSADAIAAYLESVARTQPQGKRPAAAKRKAKGDEKAKAGEEKKPDTAKSGEAKSGKPAEGKTSEPKASESKASEPKTSTPRPPEAIPGQPSVESKPDKPARSD
jgi:hypothetical protein